MIAFLRIAITLYPLVAVLRTWTDDQILHRFDGCILAVDTTVA